MLPLVVQAAARWRRAASAVPTAIEPEAVTGRSVLMRETDFGRSRACYEPALRLVAQRHHELGAIVGLFVQWLVRDDDRGSRQCSRRDAIENLLRNGDAVERALGAVAVVDGDRGPAQAAPV